MTAWAKGNKPGFRPKTAEQRWLYPLQLTLLFLLSTVLYLGFPGTREWQRLAEDHHLHTIIRGWDGWAWFAWLAAAPAMMFLVRQYPLAQAPRRRNVAALIAGCLVIYLVVAHVRYVLRVVADVDGTEVWATLTHFHTYAYNTYAMLPLDLLTLSGFLAVSFAVDVYDKRRSDEQRARALQLRAAELASEVARIELAALRGQLNPHFLFNSFNALSSLVRQRQNAAAVELIAQLSALLRLAIDRTGQREIPLAQELDFARRYLAIEQMRFGDKLRVEFAIDPAALDAAIANIVLQPLVEHAVKQGVARRTTPGTLRIAATRRADRLEVVVAHDGPEEPATQPTDLVEGAGVATTRAPLDQLYGKDYRFDVTSAANGVTRVTLDLPWRQAPA